MFKIISIDDYKEIQPNTDNFSIDDMQDDVKNSFLFLTSAYRYMLTQFLMRKIGLKYYDDLIKKSNLYFAPINSKEMDFYQYFSSGDLTYFYLRNNIHIGNLTSDERNTFVNLVKSSDMHYNEQIEHFILGTYKKVIFEEVNSDKSTLINFGPPSEKFMVLNNSLVIGFRYDEFNENGFTDDEWDVNNDLQKKFILDIKEKIIEDIWNNLEINGFVIKYDEFSIVKKNTNYILGKS